MDISVSIVLTKIEFRLISSSYASLRPASMKSMKAGSKDCASPCKVNLLFVASNSGVIFDEVGHVFLTWISSVSLNLITFNLLVNFQEFFNSFGRVIEYLLPS